MANAADCDKRQQNRVASRYCNNAIIIMQCAKQQSPKPAIPYQVNREKVAFPRETRTGTKLRDMLAPVRALDSLRISEPTYRPLGHSPAAVQGTPTGHTEVCLLLNLPVLVVVARHDPHVPEFRNGI